MIANTVNQLSGKWWTFMVRGIVALALAAACLLIPGVTAGALIYVVAAYFIIAGVAAVVAGFSFTGAGHWWALVITGIVQALLGLFMISVPLAGPLTLAYLFAIWMIMTGAVEVSSAIALRNIIRNEFWWIALGVSSLAAGAYFVVYPGVSLLALVFTMGYYGVFAGIALFALAFRLKGAANKPPLSVQHAPA